MPKADTKKRISFLSDTERMQILAAKANQTDRQLVKSAAVKAVLVLLLFVGFVLIGGEIPSQSIVNWLISYGITFVLVFMLWLVSNYIERAIARRQMEKLHDKKTD